MEPSGEIKREATRYLLGTATEDERAALEEKYFSDYGLFEQLVIVEKDLLDDYARGRLPAHEREMFERHYLVHSKRRSRAMTASALAAKLDDMMRPGVAAAAAERRRSWFPGFASRRLAYGLAFAMALLALGVVRVSFETRRLRSELEQTRLARAGAERKEKELQGLLAEQQGRNERLASDLEQLSSARQKTVSPSAPALITLLLTAGLARDGGPSETPRIAIPPGAEQLRMQLKIGEDRYRNYRLSVETADGRKLRAFDKIKPSSARLFTVTLPSRLFTDGEYVLALTGLGDDGGADPLSKTLFRVESKK
jgi:cell division protein FtsL